MTRQLTSKRPAREMVAVSAGLVVLVAIVFGQTLGFGFVNYDDPAYVSDNPIVREGLSWHGFVWALTYGEIGHWHPLTWLSHMADCSVYGHWVGGYHLTNVVLHAGGVVLLFLALHEMTGNIWRCACVAALFAIHPLRAESVAWIAERKDVLSGMFFGLTLLLYAGYVRQPSRAGYAALLVAYGLGLLSKNMLVTVPFVLLLLDWWPLGRVELSPSALVREKIPMFMLAAGSCVATALVPEKVTAAARLPLAARLANAVISSALYPLQMVFPVHLFTPCLSPSGGYRAHQIIGALLLLTVISVAAVIYRRKFPFFLMGWLWYLGMLFPTSGILQISYYAHADRYTYLPGIGLFLAGVWGFAEAASNRAVRAAVASAVLSILMAMAWNQTTYWKNSVTLWDHALSCDNNNYVAHYNLAYALLDQGQMSAAFQSFQRAVKLAPDNGDVHLRYAKVLREHGKRGQAISEYETAIRLMPSDGDAHNDLGTLFRETGRLDDAIAQFQMALQFLPRSDAVHFNLAKAFYQQHRLDQAIVQYEAVLEINPSDVESENNLAWLLATAPQNSLRDGAKAVQLAEQANQKTGEKSPVILATLAAAQAETGQFAAAAQTAGQAVARAYESGQPSLARQIQAELESYQGGRPWRE